ncbi:MAG TPA: hypothetical protein VKZ50_20910 [bacterium]|nr:hypothetical protein [bacterium]
MRNVVALLLGLLVPLLGFAGVGQAQSSIQVQGTIEAVDCDAQTITLSNGDTSNTITVAPYTAILIDSSSVPLCALQQYIGAPITVWLVANGSDFAATRVDVSGQAYATPPSAPPAPIAYQPTPLPIEGVVLGTIVVAGLLYLLVHGPDGGYYRYPYYGSYYHYYYRPYYRAYYGYYPPSCPEIVVPAPIVGLVLGTIVVGTLVYLVSRDNDGHFYRYPYYGPYRAHYYHPAYQPYRGTYGSAPFSAPIRQGDPRWDGPSHVSGQIAGPAVHGRNDLRSTGQQSPRTFQSQPVNQATPTFRGPANQPQPAFRGQNHPRPTIQQSPRTFQSQPVNQGAPTFRGPANQPQPAFRGQNDPRPTIQQPPRTFQSQPVTRYIPGNNGPAQPRYANPNSGRFSGGQQNRGRGSNCGGGSQNQSCQNGRTR